MFENIHLYIWTEKQTPPSLEGHIQKGQEGVNQRIVSICGEIFKNMEFDQTIKGVIPKNEKEEEKLLKSKKYVPLSTNVNKEVVWVRIKDLSFLVPELKKRIHTLFLLLEKENPSLDQSIARLSTLVKHLLKIQINEEHTYKTLLQRLVVPVEEDLLIDVEEFCEDISPVSLSDHQLEMLNLYRISSCLNPDERALWKAADQHVQKLAKRPKELTLKDLSHINVLLGDAGELRKGSMYYGDSMDGPTYPAPCYVREAVEKLLEEIHVGIRLCKNGSENPIVLAACMAQRFASICPFNRANEVIAGFVCDYILQRLGLPPITIQQEAAEAIDFLIPPLYGEQQVNKPLFDQNERNPTQAVEMVFEGVQSSYQILRDSL
ncbi:MAG: Fic family protein [Verrucomicrobiota bacterium]|nr:Fic family protein [Verrucomicrobiota bacterium]